MKILHDIVNNVMLDHTGEIVCFMKTVDIDGQRLGFKLDCIILVGLGVNLV